MIIDDLTIALFVLAGVRLIGFLVFLMLFIQKGKIQHIVLAFGWLIYMFGPISELINYQPNPQSLNSLQGLAASVGTYILMLSIILYFKKLKPRFILFLILVFAIPAGILILNFPGLNGLVTTSVQGFFLIGMLFLVLFNRSSIQMGKSNLSFYWLCITLFLGLFHAFGFLMFFKEAALSLRFTITFLVNLSFLEYFIYLDWEHAFQSLEKSDLRFRLLFETAPTALLDTDLSVFSRILYALKRKGVTDIDEYYKKHPDELKAIPQKMEIYDANTKALELFGAEAIEEFKRKVELLFNEETNMLLLKSMSEISNKKGKSSFEASVKTIIGGKRDVILNYSYSEKFSEEPLTTISLVDITEKNEIQKKIEMSLHEKEILLQEVHHRVKNNLTIISSILGFQSNNSDDKTKDIIRSIDNRINTMAIVHEQLYRSRNLKEIDFSNYVKELVDDIDASFVDSSNSISIIYEMDPVYLEINILIPAGMLINEIITNSYRHAFSGVEKPEIHIGLHVDGVKGVLTVSDNGCSFSESIFNMDVDTTGFIIIKALAQQLGAELKLNLKNGSEYIISIPLSPEENGDRKTLQKK